MIKHIFFDLDGTLLPMDQEVFAKGYFKGLAGYAASLGMDPMKVMEGLKVALGYMTQSDSSISNEDAFWKSFLPYTGGTQEDLITKFEVFYLTQFPEVVATTCGFNPKSNEAIKLLKQKKYKVYCLTNPLFPKLATQARVKHAGLNFEDFEEVTTYENYYSCKPSLEYYKEVLAKFNLNAEECLMVGNDMSEDAVVSELGIPVYIVTNDLINRENKDLNSVQHGDFDELLEFLKSLPTLEA